MTPSLLSELALEEKAISLSDDGRWRTKGVSRLGIKAVKARCPRLSCGIWFVDFDSSAVDQMEFVERLFMIR